MIRFQSLFESSNSKDGLVWKKSFWTRLWLSFTYLAFCLSLWNLFSSIFARANSITISLDAGTLHSACRSFRAQSAHANALVFEKTLYGFQITVYGYWSIYGIFLLLYGIKNNYVKIPVEFSILIYFDWTLLNLHYGQFHFTTTLGVLLWYTLIYQSFLLAPIMYYQPHIQQIPFSPVV